MQGRKVLENCFEFYALLAASSSLTILHAHQRGARRYAPTSITVLTALTIHLFKLETFFVACLPLSQRASCPKCFFCYSALFSAFSKFCSSCFTHLLILFWRWGSARATFCIHFRDRIELTLLALVRKNFQTIGPHCTAGSTRTTPRIRQGREPTTGLIWTRNVKFSILCIVGSPNSEVP